MNAFEKASLRGRLVLIAVVMLLALPAAVSAHRVDLKGFMDDMYIATSSTDPAVFEAQGRLTMTGGSFHARVPISRVSLVTVAPPSLDVGGCGGISLYGGAFSIIDSDAIQGLIEEVMQNTVAVLTSLVLRIISETLYQNMEGWLNKIMAVASQVRNTCQLANTLLDLGGDNSARSQVTHYSQQLASMLGKVKDGNQALDIDQKQAGASVDAIREDGHLEKIPVYGNRVWNALSERNKATTAALGDILGLSDEDATKEVVMSIFGTEIQCSSPGKENPEPGTGQDPGMGARGPLFTITDLLSSGAGPGRSDGAALSAYDCKDDECCNMMADGSVEFEGFYDHTQKTLDEIEDLVLTGAWRTDGAVQVEYYRFLNATILPVVGIFTRFAYEPQARAMLKSAMAEIIAHNLEVTFAEEMLRLSRLIYPDTDIPPHTGFDQAVAEVREAVINHRRSGMSAIEQFNKLGITLQLMEGHELNYKAHGQMGGDL